MELIYREMPADYTLVQTSDWHLGPANCYRPGIEAMIDRIAGDANCYAVIAGDMTDAVIPSDKRYASCAMDMLTPLLTPHEQADEVIKLTRFIADQVVCIGIGNHEFHHTNTFDIGRYICDQLNVPYGAYSFKFVALHAGRPAHRFYFTHGNGNLPRGAKDPIQRLANRKAALKRKLDQSGHSDCVYMGCGHNHQLLVVEPTIDTDVMLTDDGNGNLDQSYRQHADQTTNYIPSESRWYGCSGSFLRLYSEPGSGSISYGEMRGYDPAELGWLELTVRDYKLVDVKRVICR